MQTSGLKGLYFVITDSSQSQIMVMNIAFSLDGSLIKTKQVTIVGCSPNDCKLIFPIVTTQICQVTLYWDGP